ncbi:MAG: ATP-binding protein [Verrucomicrobia bacterium]|nr:ATP-binding protein [Verrucomicrobiota bacterium]
MAQTSEITFAGMLGEELQAPESAGQLRTFRAGETVFCAGDPGDGLYLIETGRVQISALFGENENRTLAVIGDGDFFGEMAVIDGAPRSATARAEIETKAFFITCEEFLELLDRRPRLALSLTREFSNRMRALNQKYIDETIQAERLAIVGRFTSTIVHDFKNPLLVIGLATEVVCGGGADAPMRQKVQHRIERQIARMNNMLNELIEFTKPSGQRPLFAPANFAEYFGPLAEEIRTETVERGVDLELVTPPPAVYIAVQPQRLARLFYNLVNNAVDEMPDGGKILLRFAVTGDELHIEVEDTGPGIAPEIARSLFQPFATHGKAHGTGLGLTICKRIVEDHGGKIAARSTPGRGATFIVTLPLVA